MKAVLMSIQPKWCELIANGKKTVEVRKTKPKLETPFKVYIYCTLPPKSEFFWHHNEEGHRTIGEYAHELIRLPNGQVVYDYGMRLACEEGEYTQDNFLCRKVIGEFVCEWIDTIECDSGSHLFYSLNGTCLSQNEILNYCNGQDLYGWHISDLVIYDKPKELSEFYRYTEYDDGKKDKRPCNRCEHNQFDWAEYCEYCDIDFDGEHCIHLQMKRPPQSWCYVEEVK